MKQGKPRFHILDVKSIYTSKSLNMQNNTVNFLKLSKKLFNLINNVNGNNKYDKKLGFL